MTSPRRADPSSSGDESSVSISLLHRLRAQDAPAWERLVSLYGSTVLAWCRQAGLSVEDAEDVHQEVFRAVARAIGDFRREQPGDSFRGWLWTVTRRKVIDHQRHRAGQAQAAGGSTAQERLAQLPAEADLSHADSAGLSSETEALYHRALELIRGEFTENTWRAFWAVTVDGQPAAEAASSLGLSVGAVYIAKSRVLARLREEFADLL
jgi:RNA polymerase sigma-70 factor (ECF subfamily)